MTALEATLKALDEIEAEAVTVLLTGKSILLPIIQDVLRAAKRVALQKQAKDSAAKPRIKSKAECKTEGKDEPQDESKVESKVQPERRDPPDDCFGPEAYNCPQNILNILAMELNTYMPPEAVSKLNELKFKLLNNSECWSSIRGDANEWLNLYYYKQNKFRRDKIDHARKISFKHCTWNGLQNKQLFWRALGICNNCVIIGEIVDGQALVNRNSPAKNRELGINGNIRGYTIGCHISDLNAVSLLHPSHCNCGSRKDIFAIDIQTGM